MRLCCSRTSPARIVPLILWTLGIALLALGCAFAKRTVAPDAVLYSVFDAGVWAAFIASMSVPWFFAGRSRC